MLLWTEWNLGTQVEPGMVRVQDSHESDPPMMDLAAVRLAPPSRIDKEGEMELTETRQCKWKTVPLLKAFLPKLGNPAALLRWLAGFIICAIPERNS